MCYSSASLDTNWLSTPLLWVSRVIRPNTDISICTGYIQYKTNAQKKTSPLGDECNRNIYWALSIHWYEQFFFSTNLQSIFTLEIIILRVRGICGISKVTDLTSGSSSSFLVTILKYYKAAKLLFTSVKWYYVCHENRIFITEQLSYKLNNLTHLNTLFKVASRF